MFLDMIKYQNINCMVAMSATAQISIFKENDDTLSDPYPPFKKKSIHRRSLVNVLHAQSKICNILILTARSILFILFLFNHTDNSALIN